MQKILHANATSATSIEFRSDLEALSTEITEAESDEEGYLSRIGKITKRRRRRSVTSNSVRCYGQKVEDRKVAGLTRL